MGNDGPANSTILNETQVANDIGLLEAELIENEAELDENTLLMPLPAALRVPMSERYTYNLFAMLSE